MSSAFHSRNWQEENICFKSFRKSSIPTVGLEDRVGEIHLPDGLHRERGIVVAVFDMAGLSTAELEGREEEFFFPNVERLRQRAKNAGKKDIHEIYERIFRGFMPKLLTTAGFDAGGEAE